MRFRSWVFGGFSVLALALALASPRAISAESGDDFDRLDGTGQSGKRVDVIEWEGNLEIHVYPAGSLAGLDLKIDDQTNKGKKVMVIGYHFKEAPKQALFRRAILGVPFFAGFKAYRDKTETEFDKIVISNNTLGGGDMVAYNYGTPSQLFPDGHPALAAQDGADKERAPASSKKASGQRKKTQESVEKAPVNTINEDGGIRPFFMDRN